MNPTLKFLTIDDQALMIEFSRRVSFSPGALVLQQGDDSARAIYTISSGVARIEVNDVSIAHLGPSSLIGDMSFVDDLPASASVVAHTELRVDVIDEEHLHTLLASVPGFATRFYKSLAAIISERLGTIAQLASSSRAKRQSPGSQIRLPGSASAFEIPRKIVDTVDGLCAEMRDLLVQARDIRAARGELEASVASSCDRLLGLLVNATASQPAQATAIGDYLFRETFPYLMTSHINEHAYFKPHGYDGDGELLRNLRANRESGHGAFGVAVDRWVLDRPIMRALRVRGAWIMQSLCAFTAGLADRMPVPVTCLMTGTSEDLLELKDCDCSLDVTCLEMDPQVLQDAAKRCEGEICDMRTSFVPTNLFAMGRGSIHTFLHSQEVIIAPDLLNRLDDEVAAVHLLDWIYERLRNDGVVIMGQIRPDHPDRAYLEHMLRWHYCYRDQFDLERLFAASKFRAAPLTFEHHPDGAQIKVICRRCN